MDTETNITSSYSFHDENELVIFEILADNIKKDLDKIVKENWTRKTLINNEDLHTFYSVLLQSKNENDLDSLSSNIKKLTDKDENEHSARIENTNIILSRVVLRVIEKSLKSIANLGYIKEKRNGTEKDFLPFMNQSIPLNSNVNTNTIMDKHTSHPQSNNTDILKCIVCDKKHKLKEKAMQFTCNKCRKKSSKKNHLNTNLISYCNKVNKAVVETVNEEFTVNDVKLSIPMFIESRSVGMEKYSRQTLPKLFITPLSPTNAIQNIEKTFSKQKIKKKPRFDPIGFVKNNYKK
jgi:hypothetical protein